MPPNNGNIPRPLMTNERLPIGMKEEIEAMITISLKSVETSITKLEQTIKDKKWSAGIAVPIICSIITALIGALTILSQMPVG